MENRSGLTKVTRVYHKKGNSREYSFITNESIESVTEKNEFLKESDRIITRTKTEFISLNENKKCKETFVNGILEQEWKDEKPVCNDRSNWNRMYQQHTGNPLPIGGIF